MKEKNKSHRYAFQLIDKSIWNDGLSRAIKL